MEKLAIRNIAVGNVNSNEVVISIILRMIENKGKIKVLGNGLKNKVVCEFVIEKK